MSELKREFVHPVYVQELLETLAGHNLKPTDFTLALKKIISGESQGHLAFKEPRLCRKCQIPLQVQERWLLELPNVFTFNF